MGRDSSVKASIEKTQKTFDIPLLKLQKPDTTANAPPVVNPKYISFKESRCDSFPKLNKLLPQFSTNHRSKDGIPLNTQNEAPVSNLLETVLTQLSPQHDSLSNWDVIEDYRIEKTLGSGAYGKVKLATHLPTGYLCYPHNLRSKVAIKYLEKHSIKESGAGERVLREIVLQSHLDHPNICKLLQVIDTKQEILLVIEHESGGELFEYLSTHTRVTEDVARHWFRQILSALQYCHTHGVVHRDMKPENLILDENFKIKIIDFGFANLLRTDNADMLETFCGSPSYASPEMISGKQYNGTAVDAWSMGVILYLLVCGYLPFDDKNISNMFILIMSGNYKIPDTLSPKCQDLIKSILVVNPQNRATLEQMRNHPWVTNEGSLPPLHMCSGMSCCLEPAADDLDTVRQIEALGYNKGEITEALKNSFPSNILAANILNRKSGTTDHERLIALGLQNDCDILIKDMKKLEILKSSFVDEEEEDEQAPRLKSQSRIIMEDSEEPEEDSASSDLSRKNSRVYSAYKSSASRRATLKSAGDRLEKRKSSNII